MLLQVWRRAAFNPSLHSKMEGRVVGGGQEVSTGGYRELTQLGQSLTWVRPCLISFPSTVIVEKVLNRGSNLLRLDLCYNDLMQSFVKGGSSELQ